MKAVFIIFGLMTLCVCSYATVVKPVNLDQEFQVNMAYDGSGNVEYIGQSLEPCGSSEACWQIKKLTYSGSNVTNVQFANGSTGFDFTWSSRAGYTYS